MNTPSPNGRDAGGRFAKGYAGGPGNPHAAQVARLRSALLAAVTPEQLTRAVEALIAQAHTGNVQAIRELFDRVLGRPVELDLIERLDRLERQIEGIPDDAESTPDAA